MPSRVGTKLRATIRLSPRYAHPSSPLLVDVRHERFVVGIQARQAVLRRVRVAWVINRIISHETPLLYCHRNSLVAYWTVNTLFTSYDCA